MASTSVHLPQEITARLDELAARLGVSRNRLIVRACERLLEEERGKWPKELVSNDHLDEATLAELREAGREMEEAIYAGRRSRPVPPL